MKKIIDIPLKKIVLSGNIRTVKPNDPDIEALAQSMQDEGQEIEVRVYPGPGGSYILKAGHRRLLAAISLGWKTISAVVDNPPANEVELLIQQAIENEHRKALTYIERARVFARLKELGLNQNDIARKFGLSAAEVSLSLAALRADPKLQEAIEQGKIKPSVAEPLLSQKPDVQAALADAAIQGKTVRRAVELVKAYKRGEDISHMVVDDDTPIVPEDVDPLEELALTELDEAVEHLRQVEQSRIAHPELVRQARPKVEELLALAARIQKHLGYDVPKDLGDLA